jgi:hypothetical protein
MDVDVGCLGNLPIALSRDPLVALGLVDVNIISYNLFLIVLTHRNRRFRE